MSNIPSMSPKDVVRLLQQKSLILNRSRGSHQKWLHPVFRKRVVIPMHNKYLPTGTLFALMQQAGIENNEY